MHVSIITPCYNQGMYLDEQIESISSIHTPYSYEHIIINDGSTNEDTISKLKELESKGFYIIHQPNLGLASARNNAIEKAKGKYIIALDADNKLHSNYLNKAIDILERKTEIDVLYGDAIFFGSEERIRKPRTFDIVRMLENNYIDACAVFKKSIWDEVGGYDAEMPAMGNEDWEFWINIFFKNGIFYYLNEPCYYYRVTDISMRLFVTKPRFQENRAFILKKHYKNFVEFYIDNYWKIKYVKNNRIKASANLLLKRFNF